MDYDYAMQVLEGAFYADVVAVDTETTGIDYIKDGRHWLTGISIAYHMGDGGPIQSAYFPLRHKDSNFPKQPVIEKFQALFNSVNLVFHNTKFDIHSLATIGLSLGSGVVYDTMMMAHMVNEEWYSKELDALAKMLLGEAKDMLTNKWNSIVGWANVPAHIMEPYARKDAELTLRLLPILLEKMRVQELDVLWPREQAFTQLLATMERKAIGVDLDFCERKVQYGTSKMIDVEEYLDFNPGSLPALKNFFFKDLGLPVLKLTPKGQPSLTKDVLEEYDDILGATNNPGARAVLEFRGWQKACSSLYQSILDKVSPDGRVRTNYKQHGTVTGRLSSSGPNLQQIPRLSENPWNGDAKRAFRSGSSDFELWGFDYSQLEFRLGTAYGRDQWLLDVFADPDGDVFTAMSERLGLPRQTCKTYTYATLYGAGIIKIAATLGYDNPADIEADYEAFKLSIEGMRNTSQIATRRARTNGFVRYWNGRRRHFGDRENDAHKAFNSILQGGAAELMKDAQLRCVEIEDENCQQILQIHDEIVFMIRPGMYDTYAPEIIDRMTNFPDFGVRLAVESKVWNDVPLMELSAA